MQQLPMVCEALLVNGPGVEKRVSVLQGVHHYKYEREGEPVTEYRVCRWGADAGHRKTDGVKIYRIGFVDPKPSDDKIHDLVMKNVFSYYYTWYPERR